MLLSYHIDNVVKSLGGVPKQNVDIPAFCEHVYEILRLVENRSISLALVKARVRQIKVQRRQLRALLKIPKIEQRSPEWYAMRTSMMTASDFAQAVGRGKFGKPKDFFMKKCGHDEVVFDANCPPLVWGVKYEEVAQDIYAKRTNMKIHEFGLLRHPEIPYLGASPDGINELGVMVEIKCPYRRRVTGSVPDQYYYQIQGQLEVCDLQDCDYWECSFQEYESRHEFDSDWDPEGTMTVDFKEKGVILEWSDLDGTRHYEYSGAYRPRKELEKWVREKTEEMVAREKTQFKFTYWFLNDCFLKRVTRDREFWRCLSDCLDRVWKLVQHYRGDKDAYEEEMAKRPSQAFVLDFSQYNKVLDIDGSAGCGGGSCSYPRRPKVKSSFQEILSNYRF